METVDQGWNWQSAAQNAAGAELEEAKRLDLGKIDNPEDDAGKRRECAKFTQ